MTTTRTRDLKADQENKEIRQYLVSQLAQADKFVQLLEEEGCTDTHLLNMGRTVQHDIQAAMAQHRERWKLGVHIYLASATLMKRRITAYTG